MRVEIVKPCRLAPVGSVVDVVIGVAETLVANGVGLALDSFPPPSTAQRGELAPRVQAPQLRPAPATSNNGVIRRPATIRKS